MHSEIDEYGLAAISFEAAVKQGAEPELLVDAGDAYYEAEEYQRSLYAYEAYLAGIGDLEPYLEKKRLEASVMFPGADVVTGSDRLLMTLEGAAYAAMMLGNTDLSSSYFERMAELYPTSYRGFVGLAQLAAIHLDAEVDSWIPNAQKAYSLMQSYEPVVVHMYALALVESGRTAEAINVIELYLQYQDQDLIALYEDLLREEGD
jgi:tetratricopeptide (TPR) repeat protein